MNRAMKLLMRAGVVLLVALSAKAVGARDEGTSGECLAGEGGRASCLFSKSLVKKKAVILSFDENEEAKLSPTLGNASPKTLDTLRTAGRVQKTAVPDMAAGDWCKRFKK